MTERPRPQQETESKGAKAQQIYRTLLIHNSDVSLYSPGLLFVGPNDEVNIWKPQDDTQREIMTKRGISLQEQKRGIVNVKLGPSDEGPFKQIAITPTNEIKVVNQLRGLARPEQKLLQRDDLLVVKKALTVATAPLEIATEFGSYHAFCTALGTDTDITFLEADKEVESATLYRNGLEVAIIGAQHEGSDYQTTAKIATDFLTQLTKAEQTGKI